MLGGRAHCTTLCAAIQNRFFAILTSAKGVETPGPCAALSEGFAVGLEQRIVRLARSCVFILFDDPRIIS